MANTVEHAEYKTIGQISAELQLPSHVIRFWESQFPALKPAKRRGGRRYYNATDIENIEKVRKLLHTNGYTIKGAKRALNQAFMAKNFFKPDSNQVDMFGGAPAPAEAKPELEIKKPREPKNNAAIKKLLENLKEIQKLIS